MGFHGCDRSVRDKVVSIEGGMLLPSMNDYDWLGNGVYFWENNSKRALVFAEFLSKHTPHNSNQRIEVPSIVGAIIDLGYCLDLLDSEYLNLLNEGYKLLKDSREKFGLEILKNTPLVKDGDLIKRNLDCAVIETIHQFMRDKNKTEFDSVRGVFFEGKEFV